jgi:hypothetical protein
MAAAGLEALFPFQKTEPATKIKITPNPAATPMIFMFAPFVFSRNEQRFNGNTSAAEAPGTVFLHL